MRKWSLIALFIVAINAAAVWHCSDYRKLQALRQDFKALAAQHVATQSQLAATKKETAVFAGAFLNAIAAQQSCEAAFAETFSRRNYASTK